MSVSVFLLAITDIPTYPYLISLEVVCSMALWRACGCVQVVIQWEGKISALFFFFPTIFIWNCIHVWLHWVFVAARRLSLVVAQWGYSLVMAHGLLICCVFSCCGTWPPRHAGAMVVAHGFSCSKACGIFPGQELNLCPMHWQADLWTTRELLHISFKKYFIKV